MNKGKAKLNQKSSALAGLVLLLIIVMSACTAVPMREITSVTPLPPIDEQAALSVEAVATPTPPPTPMAVAERATVSSATATPSPTPTPRNVQLPSGSSAAIALATDEAMKPDIETPLTFDQSPVPITFSEFYDGFDMRKGLLLSDKLRSLDGTEVVMEGYMAPPLKPALDWFVLTQIRLAFCPFCSSDADWPTDIAVVYLANDEILATQAPVRIKGRMEIGSSVDAESGMVSLVRIYANNIEVLR